MNTLSRRLLITIGSLLAGVSTLLAASSARAAVPDVWAFAYSDNPTPAPGAILPPLYQAGSFQTVCPGSTATITQIAVGKYVVNFPCSASSNGIVHVTAVNDAARYCEIERWADSGGAKSITVLCFKGSAPDNSRFTIAYTRSSGVSPAVAHAYVYAAPSGATLASYNFTGAANSITHLSTGRWEVRIPLPGPPSTYNGDFQATAVHPNDVPRRCQIDNWYSAGDSTYRLYISCTDPNGVLTDNWFTLSYHEKRSVLGTVPGFVAYMTNLVGAPVGSDYNSVAPPNSFMPLSPGRYKMHFPGVGTGRTHMHVTALGGPYGYYCQLADIWTISGSDVDATVTCFDNVGIATNNLFFSSFMSDP